MSLALSGELQGAIYEALTADAGLVALVGAEIYDAVRWSIAFGRACDAGRRGGEAVWFRDIKWRSA